MSKDLKEAYSDAVDLVEDFLDIETLEDYLYDDLMQSIVYWSQFENAINEASDTPHQEEELIAMDRDIAHEAVDRVEKKYKLIEIAEHKRLLDLIKSMQEEQKKLEEVIRYQKETYYKSE